MRIRVTSSFCVKSIECPTTNYIVNLFCIFLCGVICCYHISTAREVPMSAHARAEDYKHFFIAK